MALNLVRNSRVFFTSNVDATTGEINTTGFSTSNTQELQVLDGFTFSQNTNADTVTISEAGSDPVRGQRSFNTSLAPVDFSFSTYVRPAIVGGAVAAEEAVLWNALNSNRSIDTTGTAVGTSSGSYSWNATTGTGQLTLTSVTFNNALKLEVGDAVIISGITNASTDIEKALNGAAIIKSIYTASTASPYTYSTNLILEYVAPYAGSATPTISSTVTKLFTSAGWVSSSLPSATSSAKYALSTVAGSNKNQLQKFGMIFIVDNVTYGLDNCAMNQVTLDFGLDAIATLAWTGQATRLKDQTSSISLLAATPITLTTGTPNAITNIASTENVFKGNVLQYTSTGTSSTGGTVVVDTITGSNSLTVTGAGVGTGGTLTSVKVLSYAATGATMTAVTASGSNYTATVSMPASPGTAGVSVNDPITAVSGTATWAAGGTAYVSKIVSATQLEVTFTGYTTVPGGTAGGTLTDVFITIATLSQLGATTQISSVSAGRNFDAPFITNKLSTVTFKTVNALGAASATTYKVALTGGSLTINNNISYITPANLGVVNVPAVYYTGTRSITGTLNAYLKTGTGEGGTGQLLQDMLAAVTSSVEPMASVTLSIGGTGTNRVVMEMPSVTFSIPSIDVQQVISTAINFTAAGSSLGTTKTFAVDELNDLAIRYYAA